MGIIVECAHKILLAGSASVVEEDREFAWAEPHIRTLRRQPDLKWVLGNYVEADRANSNGQIFPLQDLKSAIDTIPNKPLNLVHIPARILGSFTAASLVTPDEAENAAEEAAHPKVEALAAYYHYYFPDLWPSIEMAHKEGQLFFSMESCPDTITCKGKGGFEGCGRTFEYAGRQSPTYCPHLNEVASRKVLNKPHFTAGALIIPPTRPGWKHADITQLSELIEKEVEAAETVYEQVSQEAPHLDPKSWERIMAFMLNAAQ